MGFRHTSPTRPMTPDQPSHRHSFLKSMWIQKLHSIFVRDESRCSSPESIGVGIDGVSPWPPLPPQQFSPSADEIHHVPNRPVGVGLPRQTTFKRQNSERRERLCPAEPHPDERRALSASRTLSTSRVRTRTRSSPPTVEPRLDSHLDITPATDTLRQMGASIHGPSLPVQPSIPEKVHTDSVFDYEERPPRPFSRTSSTSSYNDDDDEHDDGDYDDQEQLRAELDTRWILNLSMHFRDRSDREKFFVTYAETPYKWRRVTVSCDYRNCELNSLESDLKELPFQRDKSFQIYEAIRDSLPEIQFYDTVTNLKLETSQGRLHVHVTEDVNEIIPYPPRSMVRHILDHANLNERPMEVCEKDIAFEAHLSGFVYKVSYHDKTYIKKEIPSPDTIDEFLYEINALHELSTSDHVIKLEAIVVDDTKNLVKGLLISFAERGAVVDILYDNKGQIPWIDRERWARQAVTGLRDVHEAGYVQGDFTLSNVVVDSENNAKIIDINRRGCPVGWEPPEIAKKIASNQRISMYIGEKSDLFQLGMSLWALAMDDDEPERHDPPLSTHEFPYDVPEWFRNIVRICLSEKPKDRLSAKDLVELFPDPIDMTAASAQHTRVSPKLHPIPRSEKQYIDPDAAVERDDIERFKNHEDLLSPEGSKDEWVFTNPQSSEYDVESFASAYDGVRGRRPVPRNQDMSKDEWMARSIQCRSIPDGVGKDENRYVDPNSNAEAPFVKTGLQPLQNSVKHSMLASDENKLHNENSTSTSSVVGLSQPTTMPFTDPFKHPNWRRSASESTPRNSHVRFPAEAKAITPNISPRSSSVGKSNNLARIERFQTTESEESFRNSGETVPPCDVSVGETTLSGTTFYSHEFEHDLLKHKVSETQILDKTWSPSIRSSIKCDSPAKRSAETTIPTIMIDNSHYEKPALHEETKS